MNLFLKLVGITLATVLVSAVVWMAIKPLPLNRYAAHMTWGSSSGAVLITDTVDGKVWIQSIPGTNTFLFWSAAHPEATARQLKNLK